MSQSPSEPTNQRKGTVEISESDRYRLLANERRRVVIEVLADRTAPIELKELATDVATVEAENTSPRDDAIERVAIELHHNHLAMMTDVGAIEYDPSSSRIESVRTMPELL